jgi:hypothetical protein
MAKVTFDGNNYLIIVNNGITTLDVKVDLYSDWKEWVMQGDNSKYFPAFRTVGGDPLTLTVSLGDYYFLQNQAGVGWRIRPYEGNHTLTINGNLAAEDSGSTTFVQTLGNYNVLVKLITSSLTQTVSTGGGSTPSEIASAVWDATATSYDAPGTMGEKVNAAGTAGDPWTTPLPGPYLTGTAGSLVGKIGTNNVLSSQHQTQLGLIGTSGIMSTTQNDKITSIGTNNVLSSHQNTQLDYIGTSGVMSPTMASKINSIGTDSMLSSNQQTILLEIYRLLGLDPTTPLIVTTSSRSAGGGIEQTITGDPSISIIVQRT